MTLWLCSSYFHSYIDRPEELMPPPGPVLGWLCVAHSVVDIAFRAAHISCGQVLPRPSIRTTLRREEKYDASNESTSPAYTVKSFEASSSNKRELITEAVRPESKLVTPTREDYAAPPGPCKKDSCSDASVSLETSYSNLTVPKAETTQEQETHAAVSLISYIQPFISIRGFLIVPPNVNTFGKCPVSEETTTQSFASQSEMSTTLQSSRVPSSRIGRFFHYGGTHGNNQGEEALNMYCEQGLRRLWGIVPPRRFFVVLPILRVELMVDSLPLS